MEPLQPSSTGSSPAPQTSCPRMGETRKLSPTHQPAAFPFRTGSSGTETGEILAVLAIQMTQINLGHCSLHCTGPAESKHVHWYDTHRLPFHVFGICPVAQEIQYTWRLESVEYGYPVVLCFVN